MIDEELLINMDLIIKIQDLFSLIFLNKLVVAKKPRFSKTKTLYTTTQR
jgi:hypothetical protein